MESIKRFNDALYGVDEKIKNTLAVLPPKIKKTCEEIRLRINSPLSLTVGGDTVFVRKDGEISFTDGGEALRPTKSELENSYKLLVGNSVFAHTEELKEGYILMKNGCRAGVCGNFTEKGFLQDVTAVNIRIAREFKGSANGIVKDYKGESILIAGPPGCGKTTVLRDTVRQLASGTRGKYYRISLIDCRGEISGGYGDTTNDLGSTTDVLYITDKAKGIEISLRTMFPEIIAFDEIGTVEELTKVKESFFAGVSVITTTHIGSERELLRREVTRRLICDGMIDKIFLLPNIHGGEIRQTTLEELKSKYAY